MEGKKYKDLVLWNVNEPYFSPEQFAKLVAEENNLSTPLENEICRYSRLSSIIKKAVSSHEAVENIKEECIRIIEIDVRIDSICLKDRFEWDVSESENSPEDFAELLCNELGLNSEFATQIAHQIREQVPAAHQIIMYKKYSAETPEINYTDQITRNKKNRGGVDPILKLSENTRTEPVTLENYLRGVQIIYFDESDNLNNWEPRIQTYTNEEIKKHEQLEERKYRHERRGIR